MYRVPVLASAWPKNLEVARLRSGWRVVNHCCGACRQLLAALRYSGDFAHCQGRPMLLAPAIPVLRIFSVDKAKAF